MKTIGLIGGMSWESTVTYYQVINRTIKEHLGGLSSAKCLLHSLNFEEIAQCQTKGDWDGSANIIIDAALKLEQAGADCIVICTNTMHKIAPNVKAKISVPLIHIAESTATELKKNNIKKVALLGTRYTMEQDFYKKVLTEHGVEVIIPDSQGITQINDMIFKELCLGQITSSSKKLLIEIIENLTKQGAEGAILGCTELGLLINQNDTKTPLFDTCLIHAKDVALFALK